MAVNPKKKVVKKKPVGEKSVTVTKKVMHTVRVAIRDWGYYNTCI